ncbi:MAG: transaldolase family protein [Spirochaetales bacterium]|nr:transaldolase family protein [Spirochaetales bacterium]
MTQTKPPLQVMAETTDTDYWNDSCSIGELEYAIPNGAVGATTNPVIVTNVLNKELHLWEDRIKEIAAQNPEFDEDQVAWTLIEEMAIKGAELLQPVFEKEKGLKGRISIQTNAKFHRNAKAMANQAIRFDTLAPNMQVKMPVTAAGVKALEEATAAGVNINATVCFSVPQAVAVAEAVEKGIARREAEGHDCSSMTPVCTIMIGRVDDWLKVQANNKDILIDPAYLEMAGVAVMKSAMKVFAERGYRTRLLGAAYRNWNHVAHLIGGNLIHTIPYKWQCRYNGSDMPIEVTADQPVDPQILEVLRKNFPDFVRAYEPDGMKPEEFESFGPTRRTLRQFLGGYEDLIRIIRDIILPNPDVE